MFYKMLSETIIHTWKSGLQRNLYMNVHKGIVRCSQKVDTTQNVVLSIYQNITGSWKGMFFVQTEQTSFTTQNFHFNFIGNLYFVKN